MTKGTVLAPLLLMFAAVFSPPVQAAPPHPGVWKTTRMGFKSEKGYMRISPEALLEKASTRLKREGEIWCIILLAEFQDRKFDVKLGRERIDPVIYFEELIFGRRDTNKHYGFPSFREYWEINSGGKLRITGRVVGPYLLPSPLSDYACGAKNGGLRYCGLGKGTNTLLSELISLADKDVNFSDFDRDGDGSVDCLIVIHAGSGGEVQEYPISSPNCCDIWSHAFSTYVPSSDGVSVRTGVIAAGISEYFPYGNMGLIAHEFGHLLGLIDLYDTGVSGHVSCGVGPYSLMGYGLYKGPPTAPGTMPTNLSPWEKIFLGWATEVVVSEQYCDKISSTSRTSFFLKVPAYSNPGAPEYFLVEFRKRENFDSDFPVDGVLIWQIDEEVLKDRMPSNSVNTDECFPGCGKSCEEIRDRQGNFLTCQRHYAVRVVPTWKKNDPWSRERADINEDPLPCLSLDPQDFWTKGSIFPDSYTSSFGYRGIEHRVLISVYSDELNNINVAATSDSSKIVLRGPTVRDQELYNWVEPGGTYTSRIWIEGTAPILLSIVSPPEAFLKLGENLHKEAYLSSGIGYIQQEVEVIWKAPEHEMRQTISILAENCVQKILEQWDVIIQNPRTTVDLMPVDSSGRDGFMGCACNASASADPTGMLALILLISVFADIYRRVRKFKT